MHWLDMLKVRDLMHAEVLSADTDAAIREASAPFDGVRAARDAHMAPPEPGAPMQIAPEASLRNACGLMIEHGRDRLLVMHHARPVGTLSAMDVVRYLASGAGF